MFDRRASAGKVRIEDITFASERGFQLCVDIQRVSAGLIAVQEASPELTRGSDGILDVQVSSQTVDLIAGRVELDEVDGPPTR